MEIFKPIEGFPNYVVSNLGKVYSLNNGHKEVNTGRGRVDLWLNGLRVRFSLKSIVAEHFLGKQEQGDIISFHDGDVRNCSASNLFYLRKKTPIELAEAAKERAYAKRAIEVADKQNELSEREQFYISKALECGYAQFPLVPIWYCSREGDVYYVSPYGIRKKIPRIQSRGYYGIRNGRKGKYLVHRVIAHTFIGAPPPDKPFVCHIDDDKLNNHIDNLYYGDYKDNAADRMRNRPQYRSPNKKGRRLTPEEVTEIRSKYPEKGYKKLAKEYNVDRKTIQAIVKRRSWKHL